MGLLDNFERGLERLVGGAFARTFRSGVQPIEIAAALRRELDTEAAVVSRDRILVPNIFTVTLSSEDFERLDTLHTTLINELTAAVRNHAVAQGYHFAGGIGLTLQPDENQPLGVISVKSSGSSESVVWEPVIEINGKPQPLVKGRTVIGRGSDADITVNDAGISRKHLELLWDGERAQATDLGSTNGTTLNGEPLSRALVEPDSVLSLGQTRIVFRVQPQRAPTDPARTTPMGRTSEEGAQ